MANIEQFFAILNNMIEDLQTCVFDKFMCMTGQSLSQCLLSMPGEVKRHGKIKEIYYRLSTRIVRDIYTKRTEFSSGNQNDPRF